MKVRTHIAVVVAIVSAAVVATTVLVKFSDEQQRTLAEEVQAQRDKYGCKPTNEFVGKNAERLWLCQDGMKYPGDVFYYWARDARQ